SAALVWLRTKHITLNKHLHCIKKSNTLGCHHYPGSKENMEHFILVCPQYAHEHFILARLLRWQACYLPYLLSDSKAVPFLINYINSTGHLKTTFGDVPSTHKQNH
ncbi:hypothetical protein PAXRUDRAFT_153957, partial [Paxillus rubicundulus Ve08.2h10]